MRKDVATRIKSKSTSAEMFILLCHHLRKIQFIGTK